MKHLKIILILLAMCCFNTITAQEEDSVIVVKGQISDYVITKPKLENVEGYVVDDHDNPIEGATVMFGRSSVHKTSDKSGAFTMSVSRRDSVFMIYYPNKEIVYHNFRAKQGKQKIVLPPLKQKVAIKHTSHATPWFDPKNDNPTTYCNPINIGYAYRAYIQDLVTNGSFRSAADPMIVTFKGEYYLFATNQSGFYWSKDLTKWNYVFAGFQRTPTEDDQKLFKFV